MTKYLNLAPFVKLDIVRAPFDDWRRGGEGGGPVENGQQVFFRRHVTGHQFLNFLEKFYGGAFVTVNHKGSCAIFGNTQKIHFLPKSCGAEQSQNQDNNLDIK